MKSTQIFREFSFRYVKQYFAVRAKKITNHSNIHTQICTYISSIIKYLSDSTSSFFVRPRILLKFLTNNKYAFYQTTAENN